MCLVLLGWRTHPIFRLVVASNRDESYNKPAHPVAWRTMSGESMLCGLDVDSGGTWLGLSKAGRFGVVTNVRSGLPTGDTATESRGLLIPEFVAGSTSPQQYATAAATAGNTYGGFNLVVGDLSADTLHWLSNRSDGGNTAVIPGVHGLSNAPTMDARWPKVTGGVNDFADVLADDDGAGSPDRYLDVLADRRMAARRELPHTGVGLVLEKALSPRFVRMGIYGTRCSTVLRIRHDGTFDLVERRFNRFGRRLGDTRVAGKVDVVAR